jgi:ribose transport system ATP-binding protein
VGFDACTRVGDLSIANQQMVEIARALTVDAKAVIFDEPTASLTDAEKVVLFDVIADLKAHGVGIIYISHRMEEIFKITDRISVLRDGQYRGTLDTAETNEDEITQMMIGRKLDLSRNARHHELGRRGAGGARGCPAAISTRMSVRGARGEVWASTAWSARAAPRSPRRCSVCANPSPGRSCWTARRSRSTRPPTPSPRASRWCPRDRKGQGLVLGMNCRDNMTLPQVDDLKAGPFVAEGRRDRDLRPVPRPAGHPHARAGSSLSATCRAATSRRS